MASTDSTVATETRGAPGANVDHFDDDVQKTVYERHSEFYRYRDGLKWSRFQTVYAIEGAMAYGTIELEHLATLARVGFIILGTVLIWMIFRLIIMDEQDADSHLKAMRPFEERASMPFVPHPERRPGEGVKVTHTIMVVIYAFNGVALLLATAAWWVPRCVASLLK